MLRGHSSGCCTVYAPIRVAQLGRGTRKAVPGPLPPSHPRPRPFAFPLTQQLLFVSICHGQDGRGAGESGGGAAESPRSLKEHAKIATSAVSGSPQWISKQRLTVQMQTTPKA
eukprot:1156372-Pelagomonas_calceolata.AAC.7